ncbi:PIG-L deacetylase family protein [Dehalobacterium formicoaceticum]|uniref:PIG-L family deacetylase n=1 Tax=Dehalobacterium formicoaceticum TaxID=51515 RepID=A0ABT1XZX6_9FIRM|nr:PIG-L family deacetylase [Dehalobacterium formicoaceticum]MCR6544177.1 PIG-L family deacetylase [Dehalobacterium formicoaceticum]
MKILVIATHPDDEVLGCGGAIAKHVADGDDVYVCIMCSGTSLRYPDQTLAQKRKSDAEKVGYFLGVKEVIFCDFPVIMLDTIPQLEIVTALEKVIFSVQPEVLYTHHPEDINSDHRVVHHACLVWCRSSKTPFLKKVLFYEVFGSNLNFHPNYYITIDQYLALKLESLSFYTTENQVQTRTLDTLEKLAAYRGAEINQGFAEGFVLYREIE